MDPVCHTLVGAALAESGLKHRTAWGSTTLILAANAPDIDVLAYVWGPVVALGARRGWTHGVLALVVLPLVLASVMWLLDRLRKRDAAGAARFRPLLLLALLGVLTHPVLDFMNVYGIRWLMPFSDRWFYGDVLFIIDPWIWAMLAVGIAATIRRRKNGRAVPERAARFALMIMAGYIAAMGAGRWVARSMVAREVPGARDVRFMAGPRPVDPFQRSLVVDDGSSYRIGEVRLIPPRVAVYDATIPKDLAAAPAASSTDRGRTFLYWARFPFVEVDRRSDSTVVHIIDARYALDREASFGVVRVARPRSDAQQ